jgi:hypothetical protein
MLHAGNHSKKFWGEALIAATYVYNRTYHSSIDGIPLTTYNGEKADVSKFRVWGCKALVRISKNKRKKLDKQSKEMMFVGYDSYGWRFYDFYTKSVIISRDAVFFEDEPYNYDYPIEEKLSKDDFIYMEIGKIPVTSPNEEEFPAVLVHDDDEEIQDVPDLVGEDSDDEEDIVLELDSDEDEDDGENLPARKGKLSFSKAMESEMASMYANDVWYLVDPPEDKNVIKSKWCFDLKKNEFGEIIRYKSRLVAKGFTQVHGMDYNEVFAPVAKTESVRIFLALAAQKNLVVHHWDVQTAFLAGELKEEIYMEQPEGYSDNSNKVCRLKKSIYGLKQASRCWNQRLVEFLLKIGFSQLKSDPCIFIRKEEMILIHVDDMMTASISIYKINELFSEFNLVFSVKSVGEISFYLGMRVERTESGFLLSQEAFIKEILMEAGMENSKPMKTPMDDVKPLFIQSDLNLEENFPFRRILGKLIYLTTATRPDIANSVSILS